MSRSYVKIPRTSFVSKPFVNGYTDIDKCNTVFVIGNSDETENIFEETAPEYIKMRCMLTSRAVFPDITISAGYRTSPSGQDLAMQKKLYDGSEISMKNMVSEVNIEFLDFQSEKNVDTTIFIKNPVIFKKMFTIQNMSKRIPNYPDKTNEQSEIFMTKSDAHLFAGEYYPGIKLSDIQPYLFYVGTDARQGHCHRLAIDAGGRYLQWCGKVCAAQLQLLLNLRSKKHFNIEHFYNIVSKMLNIVTEMIGDEVFNKKICQSVLHRNE